MIGEKLSVVLEEIETTLIGFEADFSLKPNFTDNGFRAATKIFMSALMDKMFDLQDNENIEFQDRLNMAQRAGEDIRKLIHTYTGVDTYKMYR